MVASMSGKGNCYDNSTVESFSRFLQAELIWCRNWQIRRDVETARFGYISDVYNPRRRHAALGWKTPWLSNERLPNMST